jgi:hypothetical protein
MVDRANRLDVLAGVAALDVRRRGRGRFDAVERLLQNLDALGRLGMPEGGMEACERRVAYELDPRTALATSESVASPCARPTR